MPPFRTKALIEAGGEALVLKTKRDGVSCLHFACRNGAVEIAKALIDAGGEALLLMTDNVMGASCLHLACASRQAEVVALLLSLPCAGLAGLRERNGFTALEFAAELAAAQEDTAEAMCAASRRPALAST